MSVSLDHQNSLGGYFYDLEVFVKLNLDVLKAGPYELGFGCVLLLYQSHYVKVFFELFSDVEASC